MLNVNPRELSEKEGLDACRRIVTRYIRKHVYSTDAEDLIQETFVRIWKNMLEKGSVPYEGHCILTAKNVLREYWRKIRQTELLEDVPERDLPTDGTGDLEQREKLSGCQADCFESIDEEKKILLWRYSFKEEYELFDQETYNSSTHFLQSVYPVIEKIKNIFLPIQTNYAPLSNEEKKRNRLKIFRLRQDLIECLQNCLKKYSH